MQLVRVNLNHSGDSTDLPTCGEGLSQASELTYSEEAPLWSKSKLMHKGLVKTELNANRKLWT